MVIVQQVSLMKDMILLQLRVQLILDKLKIYLNNQLSMSEANFLFSKDYKQNFLLMYGKELRKTGITVNHASGDADLFIVQTALKATNNYPTVLIDEDTDLIVLALCHLGMKKVFPSEIKQNRASSQR